MWLGDGFPSPNHIQTKCTTLEVIQMQEYALKEQQLLHEVSISRIISYIDLKA